MDELGVYAVDGVSEALRSLRVESSIFCVSELAAPWGFRVEGTSASKFHLVLAGSCFLLLDEHEPIALSAGDLVILPHGRGHALSTDTRLPDRSLDELLAAYPPDSHLMMRVDGEGAVTRLLCGGFALARPPDPSVSSLLPDLIRLDANTVGASAWLEPVLADLEAQAAAGAAGGHAVQARIADLFITEALRCWLAGAELAGVRVARLVDDQPVALALDAIRDRFAEPWTLEQLSRHIGLSRTALSTRFRTAVGDSPMHYLTRVRLTHAAAHLATSRLGLDQIAQLTGYSSDAALAKAFKRELGQTPGTYRSDARNPPAITVSSESRRPTELAGPRPAAVRSRSGS